MVHYIFRHSENLPCLILCWVPMVVYDIIPHVEKVFRRLRKELAICTQFAFPECEFYSVSIRAIRLASGLLEALINGFGAQHDGGPVKPIEKTPGCLFKLRVMELKRVVRRNFAEQSPELRCEFLQVKFLPTDVDFILFPMVNLDSAYFLSFDI